jgi:hypothetical protein
MNRTPVASSSLVAVGYDSQQQILEIEFHDGSVYQYFEVPSYVYTGLMSMGSHGYYYQTFIKSGGYRYQRVN